MKANKNLIIIIVLIVVIMLQFSGGMIGYQSFEKDLQNQNRKIQTFRDSLVNVNEHLILLSDSLNSVDSISQLEKFALNDSLQVLNNQIFKLNETHIENRNFIANSTDSEYQRYITTHKLPAFNRGSIRAKSSGPDTIR
jgi:peptidoglycan hydrolase CwlO-like protein